MKEVKLGIVGLGGRGRALLSIATSFKCVKLVSVCDILPENWFNQQLGVTDVKGKYCWSMQPALSEIYPDTVFYEDYDKMLEESEMDAIIVETGADIHAEFCAKAIERNINVLTDIPNVASLEEADRLWNAAKNSKAKIYTGANPNYSKFSILLKEFYDKGLLGNPYCMEAEYIHWSMPGSKFSLFINQNGDWRKRLIPIRYCTHSLGPLLGILKEDLRKVSCFGTGNHADNEPKNGIDDMMCAQFQTESGIVVRLMRNKRCRAKIGHHNYRVFGSEGYMERIERFNNPVIRYNSTRELDEELKEIDGRNMPPQYADDPKAAEGHDGIDYAMLDNFFKMMSEGTGEVVTLKEGLQMTLPGIYAEESAKRGGKVLTMYYPWDKEWSTEIKD